MAGQGVMRLVDVELAGVAGHGAGTLSRRSGLPFLVPGSSRQFPECPASICPEKDLTPSRLASRCIRAYIWSMPPPPDPARLVFAELYGTVRHHVRLDPAEDSPRDVALAAVAEIVGGRDDRRALLAEAAGVMLGAARWEEERDRAGRSAALLEAAGADVSLIPEWVEEGKRRAERAALPPFGMKVLGGQGLGQL